MGETESAVIRHSVSATRKLAVGSRDVVKSPPEYTREPKQWSETPVQSGTLAPEQKPASDSAGGTHDDVWIAESDSP